MKKKIFSLIIALVMLVSMLPLTAFATSESVDPSAEEKPERQTEAASLESKESAPVDYREKGELEVYAEVDGDFISLGKRSFSSSVESAEVCLPEGTCRIAIRKISGVECNLDELTINGIAPVGYSKKLTYTDNDLIEVEDMDYFTFPESGNLLSISARIPIAYRPQSCAFKLPTSNGLRTINENSDFYSYTLGKNKGSFSMGDTMEIPDRDFLFSEDYLVPATGHPAGNLTTYLADDGTYLYAFAEVFCDNTFDHGKDFFGVHLLVDGEVKTYKVYTVEDNEYGRYWFQYTDSDPEVTWQHMQYAARIPLAELNVKEGETLPVAFEYYGTAAAVIGLEIQIEKHVTDGDAIDFVVTDPVYTLTKPSDPDFYQESCISDSADDPFLYFSLETYEFDYASYDSQLPEGVKDAIAKAEAEAWHELQGYYNNAISGEAYAGISELISEAGEYGFTFGDVDYTQWDGDQWRSFFEYLDERGIENIWAEPFNEYYPDDWEVGYYSDLSGDYTLQETVASAYTNPDPTEHSLHVDAYVLHLQNDYTYAMKIYMEVTFDGEKLDVEADPNSGSYCSKATIQLYEELDTAAAGDYQLSFSMRKYVSGQDAVGSDYQFTAERILHGYDDFVEDAAGEYTQTVHNDDAVITFTDTITPADFYDPDNGYEAEYIDIAYKLTEVQGTDDSVFYDSYVYVIAFGFSKETLGEGENQFSIIRQEYGSILELENEAEYETWLDTWEDSEDYYWWDYEPGQIGFWNITNEIQLPVTARKTLNGNAPADGEEYEFTLTLMYTEDSKNGLVGPLNETIQTVKNNGETIAFDPLVFNADSLTETLGSYNEEEDYYPYIVYFYMVTEKPTKGVIGDERAYTIEVGMDTYSYNGKNYIAACGYDVFQYENKAEYEDGCEIDGPYNWGEWCEDGEILFENYTLPEDYPLTLSLHKYVNTQDAVGSDYQFTAERIAHGYETYDDDYYSEAEGEYTETVRNEDAEITFTDTITADDFYYSDEDGEDHEAEYIYIDYKVTEVLESEVYDPTVYVMEFVFAKEIVGEGKDRYAVIQQVDSIVYRLDNEAVYAACLDGTVNPFEYDFGEYAPEKAYFSNFLRDCPVTISLSKRDSGRGAVGSDYQFTAERIIHSYDGIYETDAEGEYTQTVNNIDELITFTDTVTPDDFYYPDEDYEAESIEITYRITELPSDKAVICDSSIYEIVFEFTKDTTGEGVNQRSYIRQGEGEICRLYVDPDYPEDYSIYWNRSTYYPDYPDSYPFENYSGEIQIPVTAGKTVNGKAPAPGEEYEFTMPEPDIYVYPQSIPVMFFEEGENGFATALSSEGTASLSGMGTISLNSEGSTPQDKTVQIVKNNGGTITFDPIVLNADKLVGEMKELLPSVSEYRLLNNYGIRYRYTITETPVNGVVCDETVYELLVDATLGRSENGQYFIRYYSTSIYAYADVDEYEGEGPENRNHKITDYGHYMIEDGEIVFNNTRDVNVSVTKVWKDRENAFDTRPDEVMVQLMCDGNPYGQAVPLSEDNNWQSTWENLPAYDAGNNPVTYDVKELTVENYDVTITGDEYNGFVITNTLKDPVEVQFTGAKTLEGKTLEDKEFSFTLKGEDGTSETVTNDAEGSFAFTTISYYKTGTWNYTVKEAAGNEDGITYDDTEYEIQVQISRDEDGTLTANISGDSETGDDLVFANSYIEPDVGGLIVEKTIAGSAAETTRDFAFTVTLSDTAINGTYGDMSFTNGVATFTLKHGESKTASKLPSGVSYTVAEADYSRDGYTTTMTGETGTIVKGKNQKAEFVNTKNAVEPKEYGDLTVSKTVKGDAASKDKAFTFTVTLSDTAINGTYGDMSFTNGVATFTLKHGESKTAENLPAGVRYTVTEIKYDDYTVTKTGDTGTIVGNGTRTASFTNTRQSRDSGKTPRTGDRNSVLTWLALFLGAAAALTVTIITGKRPERYTR